MLSAHPPPPSQPLTRTPHLLLCLKTQRWRRSHGSLRLEKTAKLITANHHPPQPPCPLTWSLRLEKIPQDITSNPTHPPHAPHPCP